MLKEVMKELDKLLTDKNNEIKFLKLENEILKKQLKEKENGSKGNEYLSKNVGNHD